MNTYFETILKVLPILLFICLGYGFKKTNFLKLSTVSDMKKLVINISLPALLFIAFYQTSFDGNILIATLTIFVACCIMLLIGVILSKVFKIKSTYFHLLFGGFETGMLGYSLFVSVYGDKNISKLAVLDLGQVVFVFFILMTILIMKKDNKPQDFTHIAKSFFKSPVIIAILLGILINTINNFIPFTNATTFLGLLNPITTLSTLTVPLILIVIGYELKFDFKNIQMPFITIIIRTAILIIFAYLINLFVFEKLLHLDAVYKQALYTLFILPSPFIIPLFIPEDEEEELLYVVNTLSLNILLTLIIFIVFTLK